MPSVYPGAIDNFNDPTGVNNLSDAPVLHHSQHADVNRAINAIETELGINPSSTAATVAARLDAIDTLIGTKANSSLLNQPSGIATTDAGNRLVQNVDAAKIDSGTINVLRIPNLSGAKILGPTSGGAKVAVDAIPNLDAVQTTTGSFATARIPNLDAAKITTGTIDAARLPSSVTANANVRVVADIAARDAIPLPDRADGMLVWVTSVSVMYKWRSSGSAWDFARGPRAAGKMVGAGTAQSITHAVPNVVDFMSSQINVGGMNDLTNNWFNTITPGLYLAIGSIRWAYAGSGYRALSIALDGTDRMRVTQDTNTAFTVSTEQTLSLMLNLVAGNKITMRALQTQSPAAPLSLEYTLVDSVSLSLHYISPAD